MESIFTNPTKLFVIVSNNDADVYINETTDVSSDISLLEELLRYGYHGDYRILPLYKACQIMSDVASARGYAEGYDAGEGYNP
jgi:hypothetical protein